MRAKKCLTILTLICTIFSFIGIIYFNCIAFELGYDLSLATFGSALLGIIMSLTEYFVERRRAMEYFWQESQKTLRFFRKAKPIEINMPLDLLLECIREEQANKIWGNNTEVSINLGISIKTSAKDDMISWMEEHEPMSFTPDDDIDSILEEIYRFRMQSVMSDFENIFKTYIELSNINLEKLDNAYGNLDFFFGNQSIRAVAYTKIYNRIRNIRDSIAVEAFHFNLCISGNGNFYVCAKKAIELNDKFFEIKENEHQGYKYECIYQTKFDEIEEALEDFRNKIYRYSTKQQMERSPVTGKMIIFDDEKKEE